MRPILGAKWAIMASRHERHYARIDGDEPIEADSGGWWWIPAAMLRGVAWWVVTIFTGGLFGGVMFCMWLAGSKRCGEILSEMVVSLAAAALALAVTLVVIAATGSW